jgi:hypothetical protein
MKEIKIMETNTKCFFLPRVYRSLAEEDSDSWTFNNLAPELWEQEQKKGMQWTDMV